MSVKDKAEYQKWKRWHCSCKSELKRLISKSAVLDKEFDLSERMKWGRLDRYKPDLMSMRDSGFFFVEVEYYYNQDKIVRDIVYSHLLKARQLLFVFSNKRTEWGDGTKRVKATRCLASRLYPMVKPLSVEAISVGRSEELKRRLTGLRKPIWSMDRTTS